MRILLILTSAVNIKNTINLVQNSPKVRGIECENAILKWKKYLNKVDILVCDNTNYIPKCDDKIKILYFYGQSFDQNLGKGYGEYITLKYILKNYPNVCNYDYIIKCNSRYFVSNFKKIINKIDKKIDIYVDLHKNLSWADSRFFIMKPKFFSDLVYELKNVNDYKIVYFEHILAKFVLTRINLRNKWDYIPETPRYIGVSGTTGIKYNFLKYIIKKYCFKILRILIKK